MPPHPPPSGGGWGGPPPPPLPPPQGGGAGEQPVNRANAIAALVVNIIALLMCCFATIPGLVLAIIGVAMMDSNAQASRVCTLISWIIAGLGLAVAVVYWAVYLGLVGTALLTEAT